MTSDGTTSDRHALPVPGDGQDEPADDRTTAVSVSDPDNHNWGDLFQTLLLDDSYLDGKLVGSGSLAGRPAAGSDAPKLYVVTDGGDTSNQPYLTYNDDSAWHLADQLPFRDSITSSDSPYDISEGETLWVDASSGSVTVNLPAVSSNLTVRVVVIDASNTVTVSRNWDENIDGDQSDLTIDSERAVEFQSDGFDWRLTTDTLGSTVADIAGSGLKDDGSNNLTTEPADFAGTGLEDDGNDNLQVNTVTSGTVTLSSGSATVATGLTTTGVALGIYLDPSGNGNNSADVKATARAFWDNSADEYKVEIVEDGTSVGNPDVRYRVVRE